MGILEGNRPGFRLGSVPLSRKEVTMAKVINIPEYFDKFDDLFSPKVVGELNGQLVMLVRCEGDKVPWHTHLDEDEMFYVLDGELEVLEKVADKADLTVVLGEAGLSDRLTKLI